MALVELVMPKMGESIIEATILKWVKNVGDSVEADETILEIATDKVDSEVPSPTISTDGEIPAKTSAPVAEVVAPNGHEEKAAPTPQPVKVVAPQPKMEPAMVGGTVVAQIDSTLL